MYIRDARSDDNDSELRACTRPRRNVPQNDVGEDDIPARRFKPKRVHLDEQMRQTDMYIRGRAVVDAEMEMREIRRYQEGVAVGKPDAEIAFVGSDCDDPRLECLF